jgi:DNA-binding NtrC family response regulator
VQQAKGGTLFLQHLQCLPLETQKELVSVLRNNSHAMRLVCATTEDLERLCDEGRFYDELFYRVAALPVKLPPLRERTEDIPLLAKHYAAKSTNPHFEAGLVEFTEDAMAMLTTYHWPGNLTEFFQVISKIASTTESRVVTSQQLPLRLREIQHWPKLAEYLVGQEKQYVDMVLHACHGDKARAAAVLGVEPDRLA